MDRSGVWLTQRSTVLSMDHEYYCAPETIPVYCPRTGSGDHTEYPDVIGQDHCDSSSDPVVMLCDGTGRSHSAIP
jgi:hypothetical protein